MTGDNQNTGDTGTTNQAKFGSDQGTTQGGSFSSEDIARIVKQNAFAQDHIKTLESETAAMRAELQRAQEELAKARSIDDLLDAMRQQESNQPGTTSPQIDQQELLNKLKTEVFSELTAAQQQAAEMQNWNTSIGMLKERHGDGFAVYVDQRAAELGIPVTKLEELAKTSPNAFMELVSPNKTRTAAPTTGSQYVPANADAETEAYFTKISTLRFRNTPEGNDAKRVWADPDFQSRYRMHILEKAKKSGSTFGNTI
jgi:hypothetical protein